MLYAEKWKDILITTMDEWTKKLTELAEMANLTLNKGKKNIQFCFNLEAASTVDFVFEMEKNMKL